MEPQNLRFGGGAVDTILHPLAAVALLIAALLILTRPRDKAITPFFLACFTIPLAQVVVVGGLHFPVLRILILTVLARMVLLPGASSEGRFAGGFNRLDKVVVLWTVVNFAVVSINGCTRKRSSNLWGIS
jgi:hypothetical protein